MKGETSEKAIIVFVCFTSVIRCSHRDDALRVFEVIGIVWRSFTDRGVQQFVDGNCYVGKTGECPIAARFLKVVCCREIQVHNFFNEVVKIPFVGDGDGVFEEHIIVRHVIVLEFLIYDVVENRTESEINFESVLLRGVDFEENIFEILKGERMFFERWIGEVPLHWKIVHFIVISSKDAYTNVTVFLEKEIRVSFIMFV